jgi:hypothetical protein
MNGMMRIWGSMVWGSGKTMAELIQEGKERFEKKNPGHLATHAMVNVTHEGLEVEGMVVLVSKGIVPNMVIVGEVWKTN